MPNAFHAWLDKFSDQLVTEMRSGSVRSDSVYLNCNLDLGLHVP